VHCAVALGRRGRSRGGWRAGWRCSARGSRRARVPAGEVVPTVAEAMHAFAEGRYEERDPRPRAGRRPARAASGGSWAQRDLFEHTPARRVSARRGAPTRPGRCSPRRVDRQPSVPVGGGVMADAIREYRYEVDRDGRIFHDGTEIIDPAVLRFFLRAMAPDRRGTLSLVLCQGGAELVRGAGTPPFRDPAAAPEHRGRAPPGGRAVLFPVTIASRLDPSTLEAERDLLFCRVRGGAFRARFRPGGGAAARPVSSPTAGEGSVLVPGRCSSSGAKRRSLSLESLVFLDNRRGALLRCAGGRSPGRCSCFVAVRFSGGAACRKKTWPSATRPPEDGRAAVSGGRGVTGPMSRWPRPRDLPFARCALGGAWGRQLRRGHRGALIGGPPRPPGREGLPLVRTDPGSVSDEKSGVGADGSSREASWISLRTPSTRCLLTLEPIRTGGSTQRTLQHEDRRRAPGAGRDACCATWCRRAPRTAHPARARRAIPSAVSGARRPRHSRATCSSYTRVFYSRGAHGRSTITARPARPIIYRGAGDGETNPRRK